MKEPFSHLAGVLAYEQTVAGAPHVLPPRGRVSDGRGLVAGAALDHVLITLAGNVDGGLKKEIEVEDVEVIIILFQYT